LDHSHSITFIPIFKTLLNNQRSSTEHLLVTVLDRLLRVFLIEELHEDVRLLPPRHLIQLEVDLLDLSIIAEKSQELFLSCSRREPSDEDVSVVVSPFFRGSFPF
jgi:hypothetical protein